MADIDVQRKSGPPIWLWLLGLLLLALILWGIMSMMGSDDEPVLTGLDTVSTPGVTTPADTVTGTIALGAEAEAFLRDCAVEEGAQPDAIGVEHEFTINCFENLAAALDGLAQRQNASGVQQHTQTIRTQAQQIRQSPTDVARHANMSREAALAGASAFEALQQAPASPGTQNRGRAASVRQAAEQIDASQPQLEQTALRGYFRSAGDALRAASGTGTM